MSGYKDPPTHSRWRKGQSGNPKGRVKGQKNLKTDLAEELSETIRLKEGGVLRKLTKQRAFVKALAAKAIQGDGRAAALLSNLILRLIEIDADPTAAAPLSHEDEAVIAAFLARNLTAANPDQAQMNDNDKDSPHDKPR